jgi:hypothetical protein
MKKTGIQQPRYSAILGISLGEKNRPCGPASVFFTEGRHSVSSLRAPSKGLLQVTRLRSWLAKRAAPLDGWVLLPPFIIIMKDLKLMCFMVMKREKCRMGIGGVSHPT